MRHGASHDKSPTVNCHILFMTYWHKVQMSYRQTQPVVLRISETTVTSGVDDMVHCFRHQASGHVNSLSASALCGIGIAGHVATFLVSIFHLQPSCLYLASLAKGSQIPWPARRVRSWELEHTCTNAYGCILQIGDVVFVFTTMSIAQHEIDLLNAE